MKYKILSMFVAVSVMIVSASSRQAEAGLLLYATAMHHQDSELAGGAAVIGVGGIVLGLMFALPGGAPVLGYSMFLLDSDGNLSSDQLDRQFADRYPFIDNVDVISKLSAAVQEKYSALKAGGHAALVAFEDQEVRSILAPAELSREQIEQIVNDLK